MLLFLSTTNPHTQVSRTYRKVRTQPQTIALHTWPIATEICVAIKFLISISLSLWLCASFSATMDLGVKNRTFQHPGSRTIDEYPHSVLFDLFEAQRELFSAVICTRKFPLRRVWDVFGVEIHIIHQCANRNCPMNHTIFPPCNVEKIWFNSQFLWWTWKNYY